MTERINEEFDMAYKTFNGKAVWTRGTWLFTHREETHVVELVDVHLEHGELEFMDLSTYEGPVTCAVGYFLDNAELVKL